MDGVLVPIESSWGYVHAWLGVDNSVNLHAYLRREIDYVEFMRRDIALWIQAGVRHIREIERILSTVPLSPSALPSVEALRERGVRTAILTCGIDLLANRIAAVLGVDACWANSLQTTEDGLLTGNGIPNVTLENKHQYLRQLAERFNTPIEQTAYVGDSAFDIPLFQIVGFAVTTSPELQSFANLYLPFENLHKLPELLP